MTNETTTSPTSRSVPTLPAPPLSAEEHAAFAEWRAAAHLEYDDRIAAHRAAFQRIQAVFNASPQEQWGLLGLYQYLEHRHVEAILAGATITLGTSRLTPCFYVDTGNRIHLVEDRATRFGSIGILLRANPTTQAKWVALRTTPVCGQPGGTLREFDDILRTDLATTTPVPWTRMPLGRRLRRDELAEKICHPCIREAARRQTGRCEHGNRQAVCPVCHKMQRERYVQICAASTAAITALLDPTDAGRPMRIAELRASRHFPKICATVRSALEQGAAPSDIGAPLNWHVATVTTLGRC